jgi:plasmid stabilization system protein ParE
VRVEFSAEADAQVAEIDTWWRTNRLAAPNLFIDELAHALVDLGQMPSMGTAYEAGAVSARRVLLRRTHYHVYVVEERDHLVVVAVWSCFRGRAPQL